MMSDFEISVILWVITFVLIGLSPSLKLWTLVQKL